MTQITERYGRKVLQITKDDLDAENFYVGEVDVSNQFDGHIEIAADLGWVRFRASVSARFSLMAKAGSGIEAGEGIEAGLGIEAGEGIKAGWGIKAGEGIEAGEGIKAGWGIEAGFSIAAKWISSPLRIFAGLCAWRLPEPQETEIRAELRGGTVAYGNHVPPAEKADEPEAA